MCDLFKKPIICNLKASKKLGYGFVLIALVPVISLATLLPKYPYIISSLLAGIMVCCIHNIRLHALRTNSCSIINLRLHNGRAWIKQKNAIDRVYKIKKVSLAPEWVVFILKKPGPKIIVDAESVDRAVYCTIRREITTYKH